MSTRFTALLLLVCMANMCRADLVLQSEFSSYAVDPTGSTMAAVNIYIAQTGTTTAISDGGGLNTAGFEIVPDIGDSAPTLQSIEANSAFDFLTSNLVNGSLFVEMSDLADGVLAENNRVWLGIFTYVGFPEVNSSTSFTIRDRPGDQTYTATGVLLDADIMPGSFNIAVPEPGLTGVMLAATMLLPRSRRR
jgi:hypothetical protein